MSAVQFFLLFACNLSVKQSSSSEEDSANEPETETDSQHTQDTSNETMYTVMTSVVGDGEITPSEDLQVQSGEIVQFTLLPNEGFEISDVLGNCGGVLDNATYTTAPVQADCLIQAQFTETVLESVAYCSNIPAAYLDTVVCDPEIHLDDWSAGASFSTNSLMIPEGKIVSLPFTSNAVGLEGSIMITNNMPGMQASGIMWKGWFSSVPGEPLVDDSSRCSRFSPNPNPLSISWNQTAPHEYDCFLGTTVQTLYFNMEVRCYEEMSSVCTPGEAYDGDYYLGLFNILD